VDSRLAELSHRIAFLVCDEAMPGPAQSLPKSVLDRHQLQRAVKGSQFRQSPFDLRQWRQPRHRRANQVLTQVIPGGRSSTTALQGSTEEAQFHDKPRPDLHVA
jgi:hypothetical protein